MKLLVITLAPSLTKGDALYSYAPYVREMDIWFRHANQVTIVSPTDYKPTLLTQAFKRTDIEVVSIPWISFGNFKDAFVSFLNLPLLFFTMIIHMRNADHIHLRCPGTITLIGCVAQLFFPKKPKTAKYAGNWDPNAQQPLSYRLQKWILSNTLLTKNMKVLVYGDWPNQSKNILPFFTASYTETNVSGVQVRNFQPPYKFLFVGSLAKGKRPLYAIKLIEALLKRSIDCTLSIYGDGEERAIIERYISERKLEGAIVLYGNQPAEVVEKAYRENHFMVLPSVSEGWPKVVAEAMFWGAIPIVTPVSCVPWMLANGKRGLLLKMDVAQDVATITNAIWDAAILQEQSKQAQRWSQQYTLDRFEAEIKKLIAL